MELRAKPHVKEAIRTAAALAGVTETTFISSAAYAHARATIAAHEQTVLTAEDRAVFFAALENPAAPSEALKEAFDLYDRMVVDDQGT